MFVFHFRVRISKNSPSKTFTGTWSEFEDKWPAAFLTATPEPVED